MKKILIILVFLANLQIYFQQYSFKVESRTMAFAQRMNRETDDPIDWKTCDYCEKEFCSAAECDSHMLTCPKNPFLDDHQKRPNDNESNPNDAWVCNYCNHFFETFGQLASHQTQCEKNTDSEDCTCCYCNMKYYNARMAREHEAVCSQRPPQTYSPRVCTLSESQIKSHLCVIDKDYTLYLIDLEWVIYIRNRYYYVDENLLRFVYEGYINEYICNYIIRKYGRH